MDKGGFSYIPIGYGMVIIIIANLIISVFTYYHSETIEEINPKFYYTNIIINYISCYMIHEVKQI